MLTVDCLPLDVGQLVILVASPRDRQRFNALALSQPQLQLADDLSAGYPGGPMRVALLTLMADQARLPAALVPTPFWVIILIAPHHRRLVLAVLPASTP